MLTSATESGKSLSFRRLARSEDSVGGETVGRSRALEEDGGEEEEEEGEGRRGGGGGGGGAEKRAEVEGGREGEGG